MSKSVFLFVSNHGDFDAEYFERDYDPQTVYEEMISEGVTKKRLRIIDDEYEDYTTVKIVEFGEVDPSFEEFVLEKLCDYDMLKARCIYRVDPVL
jgi:hypothetical protein